MDRLAVVTPSEAAAGSLLLDLRPGQPPLFIYGEVGRRFAFSFAGPDKYGFHAAAAPNSGSYLNVGKPTLLVDASRPIDPQSFELPPGAAILTADTRCFALRTRFTDCYAALDGSEIDAPDFRHAIGFLDWQLVVDTYSADPWVVVSSDDVKAGDAD